MNKTEIQLLVDSAIRLENVNLDVAIDLMRLAHRQIPNNRAIIQKLKEYESSSLINNGDIHIHFGVHKTATTYIQNQLELIIDPKLHYTNLKKFRKFLKNYGYVNYIKSFSNDSKVVISDENMIGNTGTVLTGTLYPKFKNNVQHFIKPFLNKKRIKIFITIRPMTSFLPSEYCEYLRWNPFITYEKYTSQIHILELNWFDVISESIIANPDIEFYILNFTNFSSNKNTFLKTLSFGFLEECSDEIPISRKSFSYSELHKLSNRKSYFESQDKFDPHSEEEKALSLINFQNDIDRLQGLKNVKIIK